jgi:tripartite-type tricarboxylate transporter receptor subunit TctC
MAAIKISHVPYKGIAPAINDLLGGHVAMAFSGLPQTISHVNDGKLRALAVTGLTRSKIFPTVPTVADAALPGYEVSQRFGIVSPNGTPRAVIEKLNATLREALASEDVKMRMAFDGTEPFARHTRRLCRRYRPRRKQVVKNHTAGWSETAIKRRQQPSLGNCARPHSRRHPGQGPRMTGL